MGQGKHVHCWSAFPQGAIEDCRQAPLEQDSEVLFNGRVYRPLLVFNKDRLVIQRDIAGAYVVTPDWGGHEPTIDDVKELIGAGAGTA